MKYISILFFETSDCIAISDFAETTLCVYTYIYIPSELWGTSTLFKQTKSATDNKAFLIHVHELGRT